MTQKGGARRSTVSLVDQEALQVIFDEVVSKNGQEAFNLGAYDNLKVTQACNAGGLCKCAHFVQKFLEISNGEILAGQLKQCLMKHARTHNVTAWNDQLWSGKLAAQFGCLLSHVRRLEREPDKLRQCLATATGMQRQTILELVDLKRKACKKASPSANPARSAKPFNSPDGLGNDNGAVNEEMQQACKKARTLKQEVSDISLDSDGFPNILSSPKRQEENLLPEAQSSVQAEENQATILEKRKATSARDALEQAAEAAAQDFRPAGENSGSERRPKKRPACSKEKEKTFTSQAAEKVELEEAGPERGPAKKPACLKAAKTLKRLLKKDKGEIASRVRPEQEDPGLGRRPWSKVKKTLAKEQSYLQGYVNNTWKLIVSCSAKMAASHSGGHQAIINELEKVAMDEGMTKEKTVAERNDLLKDVD